MKTVLTQSAFAVWPWLKESGRVGGEWPSGLTVTKDLFRSAGVRRVGEKAAGPGAPPGSARCL